MSTRTGRPFAGRPYRYECPSGHQWNVKRDEAGKILRTSPDTSCCPQCGYLEDEGRGPIIDHGGPDLIQANEGAPR